MLYLIGGCGRTGKSTLALSLLGVRPMMSLSLDVLVSAVKYGAPEAGLRSEMPWSAKCALGEAFVEPAIRALAYGFEDALVEGDAMSPDFVSRLDIEHRSVFLGWAEPSLEQLLANEGRNKWVSQLPHEDRKRVIGMIRLVSREIERECARNGIAYFDLGNGFGEQQRCALEHLLAAT